MSLAVQTPENMVWSFPRVSGDEPDRTMTTQTADMFSPRERG